MKTIKIGGKEIGSGRPVFIVAEIGLNHNGDVDIAKKLIDVAVLAGCDAVKFQKRTPELCVPEEYKDVKRETPWGVMTYLEYRKRVEFGKREYDQIDAYCREKGIIWFASPWDLPSIEFLESYDVPLYKVPSALMTHKEYLSTLKNIGKLIMLSSGMSDMNLVKKAISITGDDNVVLMHTTSTYPAKTEEINLRVLQTYVKAFNCPVGYSGHEVGLQITLAAVALGANAIERHITLDRSMWGSDQAASVEPTGLMKLVRDIRIIENALGDGVKRVLPREEEVVKRLRKISDISDDKESANDRIN